MKIEELAHTKNHTLEGHKKALYAQDDAGNLQITACDGWEVEGLVTEQAVLAFHALRQDAQAAYKAGIASSLAVWMYHCRMDVLLLSQATGIWQWRIKRHLLAKHFQGLKPAMLQRYADAFGITVTALNDIPSF